MGDDEAEIYRKQKMNPGLAAENYLSATSPNRCANYLLAQPENELQIAEEQNWVRMDPAQQTFTLNAGRMDIPHEYSTVLRAAAAPAESANYGMQPEWDGQRVQTPLSFVGVPCNRDSLLHPKPIRNYGPYQVTPLHTSQAQNSIIYARPEQSITYTERTRPAPAVNFPPKRNSLLLNTSTSPNWKNEEVSSLMKNLTDLINRNENSPHAKDLCPNRMQERKSSNLNSVLLQRNIVPPEKIRKTSEHPQQHPHEHPPGTCCACKFVQPTDYQYLCLLENNSGSAMNSLRNPSRNSNNTENQITDSKNLRGSFDFGNGRKGSVMEPGRIHGESFYPQGVHEHSETFSMPFTDELPCTAV